MPPLLKAFKRPGIFGPWCDNEALYIWRDIEAESKTQTVKLMEKIAAASAATGGTRAKFQKAGQAGVGTVLDLAQREGGILLKDVLIDYVQPWWEYNSRVGHYPGRGAAEQLFPSLHPAPRHPWERQSSSGDSISPDTSEWKGKLDFESPIHEGKALRALWDYYRKDLTPADFRREALVSVKDQCTITYSWTKGTNRTNLSICGWMRGAQAPLSRRQQFELFFQSKQGIPDDPWVETRKSGRGVLGELDFDF